MIPLGVGGFFPTQHRETASILVVEGATAILLDAGTGVKRFGDNGILDHAAGIETLHVFFSHFHQDHVCGFTWLLRLWPGKLDVYLPSAPLVATGGKPILACLTGPPLFGLPFHS